MILSNHEIRQYQSQAGPDDLRLDAIHAGQAHQDIARDGFAIRSRRGSAATANHEADRPDSWPEYGRSDYRRREQNEMMHCPNCGRESFEPIESPEGETGYQCFKCGFMAEAEGVDDLYAQEEEEIQ